MFMKVQWLYPNKCVNPSAVRHNLNQAAAGKGCRKGQGVTALGREWSGEKTLPRGIIIYLGSLF